MKSLHTRRGLLGRGLQLACFSLMPQAATWAGADRPLATAEAWLDEVLISKALAAPLRLSRFVEPMYYLLDPGIKWTPNPDNGPLYAAVSVPQGFVTDLASIPPVLFSILRADGDYAQAAIVHDYLYWTQRTSREYADDVFRIAMRDLEVSKSEIQSIYLAVRKFGQAAWDENAIMKQSGERRFLKNFPTRANVRWKNWKLDRSNFHEIDL